MKKLFKKAMVPRKSFSRWAEENNVRVTAAPKPAKPKFAFVRFAALAVCLLLFGAVLLPIMLPFGGDNPPPVISTPGPEPVPQPKVYTSQDIISERINNVFEIYRMENLLLFDIDQIVKFEDYVIQSIFIDYAKDDDALILSCVLNQCLIMTSGGTNAYYVDYRIRLYQDYEFISYREYSDLIYSFTDGNIEIHYKIVEEAKAGCFVNFDYNGLGYFLKITNYLDPLNMTEADLKLLLTDLFNNNAGRT